MATSEYIRASEFPPHTGENYVIRIRHRAFRHGWFNWRVGRLDTLEDARRHLKELDHENYEYRVIYANVPPVEWKVVKA